MPPQEKVYYTNITVYTSDGFPAHVFHTPNVHMPCSGIIVEEWMGLMSSVPASRLSTLPFRRLNSQLKYHDTLMSDKPI